MNYQEFIENVKDYVTSQLNSGQRVSITRVTKNNGIVYDGLFIVDPMLNVTPTIYLNPYYHRYLNGVSLEDIYEDILTTYQNNLPDHDFDISIFTDFSKARERIVMKLINRKRNEALLREVPFIPYMDLAIVFVCMVSELLNEYATILIYHQHLKLWNIGPSELYQIAMNNSPRLLPVHLESAEHLFEKMSPSTLSCLTPPQMYILSNQIKVHGATSILYPGLLDSIADNLGCNLIIIPSSIHEVLIFPENNTPLGYSMEHFEALIHEVNDTQLTDDEILGDHAYLYNRETGLLEYEA